MTIYSFLIFLFFLNAVTSCKTPGSSDATLKNNFLLLETNKEQPEYPGIYAGFANTESGYLRLKVEILAVQQDDRTTTYSANLFTFFGSFMSNESLAFRNEKFDHDRQANQMTVSSDSKFISEISFKGNEVSGVLNFSGTLVPFVATKSSPPNLESTYLDLLPENPPMQSWTGEYYGVCSNRRTLIQLVSVRSKVDHKLDNSHLPFSLMTQVAQSDSRRCKKDLLCIESPTHARITNIAKGMFELTSKKSQQKCQFAGSSITCEGCSLERRASIFDNSLIAPTFHTRNDPAKPLQPINNTENQQTTDAQSTTKLGQYYGVLNHDYSSRIQNISLYTTKTKNGFNTTVNLYHGNNHSQEFSVHNFENNLSDAPLTQPLRLEGKGEAFAIVNQWTETTVRGSWFSKQYGFIGSFNLQRDKPEKKQMNGTETSPHVPKISGSYTSKNWEIQIATAANVSADEYNMFPATIYGWAQQNVPGTRKKRIINGQYNPYNGSVHLLLDDGHHALGHIDATGNLQLAWSLSSDNSPHPYSERFLSEFKKEEKTKDITLNHP